MGATNKHKTSRWSEEKISSAVLIILVTLSVVMFTLFFSVGYNEPWEENTEFINPQYTDSLIHFMFVMGAAACAATIGSVIWNFRCHGRVLNVTGGIPAGKIAAAVIVILAVTLSVTYAASSGSALIINGKSYTDSTWICITDMLIRTIETMFVLAVIAVVYGMSGINRRIQKH